MKKLLLLRKTGAFHWVGDGFPVRTIFSYDRDAEALSPFLLMDYAGPETFAPSEKPRGVGPHPHRGFETVTIAYSGEIEHRDSAGGGGIIHPGGVQWMTAGSGIVHEEMHSARYAREGGPFEMIQLWVNLSAADKKAPPAYQNITEAEIPSVSLSSGGGRVRVIAGNFLGTPGPARTHSPMNVWDVHLNAGSRTVFSVPEGWTTALFVRKGQIRLGTGESAGKAQLAVLSREDGIFAVEAAGETALLILNGEPIREPVAGYGPFVMNTKAEIAEAIDDYRKGRMGSLAAQA
jgi:hypothetical protein